MPYNMKKFFLSLLVCMPYMLLAQDVPFENSDLLSIPGIAPEACDYPLNIPYFYSIQDYSELKYSGTISENRLHASRTWEETFQGEVTTYKEEIIIEFGYVENAFRNIRYASYTRWATQAQNYYDEYEDFGLWLEQLVKIDYEKDSLFCAYTANVDDSAMCLSIVSPSIENVDALRSLCYFYRNNTQQNTVYTKVKTEDAFGVTNIKVNNFTELLENLRSNTTVELDAGMYNLSRLDTSNVGRYFRWSYYFEGSDYAWDKTMLVLRNLENVVLKGAGDSPSDVKIFSEDSKAIVLIFENCKNVTIDNLWLGHITQSESCFGGVLSFVGCDNIRINNTQMYGTGFYGFEAYDSKKISCTNSEIWDCTGGAFHIAGCDTAIIDNCNIYDNTSRSHFSYLSECPYVLISNSTWRDNKIEDSAVEKQALFRLWNSNLMVRDSKFNNNHVESFVTRKPADTYVSEGVDATRNIIDEEFESIDE